MSAVSDDFDFGNGSDDEPMVNSYYYLLSYFAPLLIKLACMMNYYYACNRKWQMAPIRLPPVVEEKGSVQYAGLKVIRLIISFFIPKAIQMLKLVQRVRQRKTPFISRLEMSVNLMTKTIITCSEMILKRKAMFLIARMNSISERISLGIKPAPPGAP